MKFTTTPLQGSYLIELVPFSDERGWFARTFSKEEFSEIGFNKEWVQMNHSYTNHTNTIRGMHFQLAPHREIKLVRCLRGKVFDVIVDLRKDSLTFLQWFGAELSGAARNMLYVPEGFAHGFQTLTEDCEMLYCHSESYHQVSERGLRYNDPRVNIQWPLPVAKVSERDANHPLLTGDFNGI